MYVCMLKRIPHLSEPWSCAPSITGFREGSVPESYYEYLGGDIDRKELFQRYPVEADEATKRCLQVELGSSDLADQVVNNGVRRAVSDADAWVLIGGPPCQAYSTIGRVKNHSLEHYDPDTDVRLGLYHEYLKVIATHWPAVFVMENVRGLLSASYRDQMIFGQMLADLRDPLRALAWDSKSASREYQYKIYSLTTSALHLDGIDSICNQTDFVVKAEDYGVPQARHRVVILGVRDDVTTEPEPLSPALQRINAGEVLDGLPSVRSGLSSRDSHESWSRAIKDIVEQPWWEDIDPSVQDRIVAALSNLNSSGSNRGSLRFLNRVSTCSYKPEWFEDKRLTGTLNHEARTHRADDLWRYIFAACVMEGRSRPFRVKDFPTGLRPLHKNVENALRNSNFADRFSVQRRDSPSKTVVNHIRKDGHYYIHYDPRQCRSLTVREAARLQTFPDNYFFEGNRTDQYGQVGNAVPPLLSLQIAERVADFFGHGTCSAMDNLSPEHRSWNMSRIRGGDTRPELVVRSLLHRMGYRFRLHRKDLPGRPDIVLPRPTHSGSGARMLLAPSSRMSPGVHTEKQPSVLGSEVQ